jgi:hypothetical protein
MHFGGDIDGELYKVRIYLYCEGRYPAFTAAGKISGILCCGGKMIRHFVSVKRLAELLRREVGFGLEQFAEGLGMFESQVVGDLADGGVGGG